MKHTLKKSGLQITIRNRPKWLDWLFRKSSIQDLLGSYWFSASVALTPAFIDGMELTLLHKAGLGVQHSNTPWGFIWWCIKYLLGDKFRLEAEASAYSIELRYMTPKSAAIWEDGAVYALAGPFHNYAAKSVAEAEQAISRYKTLHSYYPWIKNQPDFHPCLAQ